MHLLIATLLTCLIWSGLPLATAEAAEPANKVIHVFVALCDNASQGIQPVPAKIGNGDDPASNLYWGCDDGIKPLLLRSKAWKKILVERPANQEVILERAIFQHKVSGTWLVADAYRGKEIKTAISDYFAALAGKLKTSLTVGDQSLEAGGKAALVMYAGHDGLMEFDVEVPAKEADRTPPDAAAFCCISHKYFHNKILTSGAKPLILTTQLMYPGGFLLQRLAEGWIANQAPARLLESVAASYAGNQRISLKSAKGIFWCRSE